MHPARLVASLLVVLSACAAIEVGRQFDLSAFESKVQRGITTQAEVRGWLGAPAGAGMSVESNGERFEQWTYYHGEATAPGMSDARLKILQIKFDRRGLVHSYNWSGEGR